MIAAIHGQTDHAAFGASDPSEPFHEVDYRFEDIDFPVRLPDWYFSPEQYGAHRADFPQ